MKQLIDITRTAGPVTVQPTLKTIMPSPVPVIHVSPHAPTVVAPKRREVLTIAPARAHTVKPPDRGAWDERGWTRSRDGQGYEGHFVVGRRRFRGRIEVTGRRGQDVTAYIYDPPPEVRRHRHGPCFQLVEGSWFRLHWHQAATTVDDAILYMERVLDESLRLKK